MSEAWCCEAVLIFCFGKTAKGVGNLRTLQKEVQRALGAQGIVACLLTTAQP